MNLLHNVELEQDVLGAIIANNEIMDLNKLEPKHFYSTSTKEVFKVMLKLKKQNKEIDYINLKYELKDSNNYNSLSKMVELSEGKFKQDLFTSNQKEIIRLYEKRITKEVLLKALEDLGESQDVTDILSNIQKISEENIKTDIEVVPISDAVEETVSEIEEAFKRGELYSGMESGYTKLDNKLSGFNKKDFTVIAARPSKGKTAFALELALRLSVKNKVLFFSLEMPREKLVKRLISSRSLIPLEFLKNGRFKEDRFEKIILSADDISKRNLKIVDQKDTTVEDIKRVCVEEKNKNGLDIVIIDYLTLCSTREKKPNLREEVNYISKQLRLLTDLDIAVISLAQLNRAVEGRTSNIPMLSDLKESGNIEQDANNVLLLSEQEDTDIQFVSKKDEEFQAEILNLTIAKNRDGQNNVLIKYKYYKRTQLIEEL